MSSTLTLPAFSFIRAHTAEGWRPSNSVPVIRDCTCCRLVLPYLFRRCVVKFFHVSSSGSGMKRNSVTFGSVSMPILLSKNANLSLMVEMSARTNAFSTRLIHISMFPLSNAGSSGFLVRLVTSRTCSLTAVRTAPGSIVVTAVVEAVMEARAVSWTRARIASASMIGVGVGKSNCPEVVGVLGDRLAESSRLR